MGLSPKRLKEEDYEKVQKALVDFYHERPDEYGLMERPQKVYQDYAEFIWKVVPNKNSSILDLGSGSWRIPDAIAEYGYKEVIGLDYFSDEKLEYYTKQIKNTNAKLVSYKDDSIPFPDSSFDAVSSLCVLEHIVYVENFLQEINRVLKPKGYVIILSPNWSGINAFINGFFHVLFKRDRFWQLNNLLDCVVGAFRSLGWYFENLFSTKPKFIMIYPRMKNGKIAFERSDDDAVHLCQPLSIKKFFKKLGYRVIHYNRGFGTTKYTFVFNRLFPSLATTNVLVFHKP
jgi:SAM-dependent methyltransferase